MTEILPDGYKLKVLDTGQHEGELWGRVALMKPRRFLGGYKQVADSWFRAADGSDFMKQELMSTYRGESDWL